MNNLFIDLEVDSHGNIQMIWAIDQEYNNIYKWSDMNFFLNKINDYDTLVWHNILDHDIEYLTKKQKEKFSQLINLINKPIIDTLRLSSLIFIRHPYHRLIKDYKIDKTNDPLEDSKLCLEVFENCCSEFLKIEKNIQNVLYLLLKNQKEFKTFFEYLIENKSFEIPHIEIIDEIKKIMSESFRLEFFENSLPTIIKNNSVEFAYILRLLYIKSHIDRDISVFPGWIVHKLPDINKVFQEIFKYKDDDPQKELKRIFGYDEFKVFKWSDWVDVFQEEVVIDTLDGKDILVVFATWWGKSLTFQLPALIIAEQFPYLTIVISPLQSLMKDQVDVLNTRHNVHNVGYLNSTLNPLERKEVNEKIEFGWIDLLYLSPEMLRTKSTKSLLSKRLIARIVIDEAHCFSKRWHDFRIDYMFIADFVKELSKENKSLENVNISCFTATAKQDVTDEIKKYFKDELSKDLKEFRSTVKRDNLRYRVCDIKDEEERFEKLVYFLENEVWESPCIIFTRYTGQSNSKIWARTLSMNINDRLWENKSIYYHGQLKSQEKREIQDNFIKWNINIIVATNAFGMWVDKENVRYIIHYWIPSSVENYLQEAWRAWRDWKESDCIILYNHDDINENLQLNKSSEVKQKEIKSLLNSIKNKFKKKDAKWIEFSAKDFVKYAWWISKDKFEEEFYKSKGIWETKVKTALFFLEKFWFIKRSFNSTRVWATANNDLSLIDSLKLIEEKIKLEDEEERMKILQIYKAISQSKVISIEDLSMHIWRHFKTTSKNPKKWIEELIKLLRKNNFIESDQEITINLNCDLKFTSKEKFDQVNPIIYKILSLFSDYIQEWQEVYLDKKQMNTKISKEFWKSTVMWEIDDFLNFLKQNKYIKISWESILFKEDATTIRTKINDLICNWIDLVNFLLESFGKNQKETKNISVVQKLNDLTASFSKGRNIDLDVRWIEEILKFLHTFEIIRIESWLFLYHTKFQIQEWKSLFSQQFTKEHYQNLLDFYEKKVEQAHIVDEFAQRLKQNQDINQYVDDYFDFEYEKFLEKYFKNRLWEIRRPISKRKFEEIHKWLSEKQNEILKSKDNLLIIAWPGAWKTKSLVHKVASLVLEDWINKEEFLLLSFSRSAKFELKKRIVKILWNQWYFLEINTFHGYAFKLLQREPSEEDLSEWNTKNIIKEAIKYLEESDDLLLPYSILILDEFQDINDDQFKFIQLIKEKSSKWENMKIVATWDDDQNIFWFQWWNIQHIQTFKNENNAQQVILETNYRSTQKLIDYTTQFIDTCRNRIKENTKLVSSRNEKEGLLIYSSIIETWNCSWNYLYWICSVLDVLEKIKQSDFTTAIICHDNETWLLIDFILREKWYQTQLLLKSLWYNISTTLEMQYFINFCWDKDNLVSKENIRDKYRQVVNKYWENKNTALVKKIIEEIEIINKYIDLNIIEDFIFWLTETDLEDNNQQERIIISTFHKAKWREFDNIIICFDPNKDRNRDFNDIIKRDDIKRLIYVGMTRAKNNLIILWNKDTNKYFDFLHKTSPNPKEYEFKNIEEQEIELITSCKDINIWYNFFQKSEFTSLVDIDHEVVASIENNILSFVSSWLIIQKSSKFFKESIEKYMAKWYEIKKITVYQRLKYYLKDQKEFALVYLFQILLKKNIN